jgi:hypothetical protein
MVCSARSQRMFGAWFGLNGSQAWVISTIQTITPSTRLLSTKAAA